MRELLLRLRVPLILAVLVGLGFATMLADRSAGAAGGSDRGWFTGFLLEVAVPIQQVLAWPVDTGRELWESYVGLLEVREDNEELRARIHELEEENLQYREALVAGGRLARIAAMREDFASPMLPAEVMGRDVSPWFRSVLLDRGNQDGVRAGMPLVTDRGVAGVVRATSPNASRGMLLVDRQSAIDGIVQRSRARGIVHGNGTGALEFGFVVRGDDVEVGDVVISSGLGGVYPKGLRIGEVVSVHTDQDDLLHTARIRPAVDFGRLEHVFVMLRRGPGMALLYGGEGDIGLDLETGDVNGGGESE